MTGLTSSLNFPVTNNSSFEQEENFDTFGFSSNPGNIFVAKLDKTGKLIFASYGGPGYGTAITLEPSGVYVTGEVFPPKGDNVIGYTQNNDGDTFVWRFESQQGLQDYYRVYGAEGEDFGNAIAVDSAHNAWVAGAYYVGKRYNNPKSGDVFILELTPAGDEKTEYLYASNGEDVPYAMTIGPATGNRAWITGKTCGDGFPTTDGMVHHMSHCGVFLLDLENSGVQDLGMVFGGSDGDDEGDAIVPNGPNSVYVAGRVNSSDFPATQGAFQTLKTAGAQGFVTQIDGTSLPGKIVHSTLFGADGTTVPSGIANADGKGVYLSGYTSSIHLPGGPVMPPSPTAGFVTKFSPDLSQVRYTVIMNVNVDGIAVQNPVPGAPLIYATGLSASNHNDGYVAKLDESTPTSSVTTQPIQVDGPSIPISWSGTDSATPIATYDIYVSDNFGPFIPFQTGTPATSATFNGTLGHSYGFFSVATDGDGNREPMKSAPDTVARDGPPPPATITCTNARFRLVARRQRLPST